MKLSAVFCKAVRVPLLGIVMLAALPASVIAQAQPLVAGLDSIEWGPPGGGNGFPLGVQTVTLGTDEKTGGITYYARFPADSRFELHWHTHDEYVVVLSGTVVLVLGDNEHSVDAGDYIVIPGGLNHSWDVPGDAEVVILVRRAGPADFHFVREP